MSLPISSSSLDFIDGYLFRVLVDILRSDGTEGGLFEYYEARIKRGCALSSYDRMIHDFVLRHFDQKTRRVVHAGIGIGTLTSALAVAGYHIAGIEHDDRRFQLARRVRDTLVHPWPHVAQGYDVIRGSFPQVVEATQWRGSDNVLIFTNCGAGWTDELAERIIAAMAFYGDAILDTRLFGHVRESPPEREELIRRIEAQGFTTMAIEQSPPGTFYYHIQPLRKAKA